MPGNKAFMKNPMPIQKARETAIINNYRRKQTLDCLRMGHMTLAQFREEMEQDKRLHPIRVRFLLGARLGMPRAIQFMKEIAPFYKQTYIEFGEKKVSQLGPDQWHRLIGRVDSAHPA